MTQAGAMMSQYNSVQQYYDNKAMYEEFQNRKLRSRRMSRETLHLERNGVIVSSDDSSDDEDVVSATTRRSKLTIHQEANGIYVSSDDEDDDHTVYSPQRRSANIPRPYGENQTFFPKRPASASLETRNAGKQPLTRRNSGIMKSTSSKSSVGSGSASVHSNKSFWSSGDGSTDMSSASSICSNSVKGSPVVLRRRKTDPTVTGLVPPQPPSSVASRRMSMPKNIYCPPVSTNYQPNTYSGASVVSVESMESVTLSETSNTQGVKLIAADFWDPSGMKATNVEIVVIGAGVTIAAILVFQGLYLWTAVALATLIFGNSYICTRYRIYSWRNHSGLAIFDNFDNMYELVEQVCMDTRMMTRSGVMKPRTICAGELADALRKYCRDVDDRTLMRFWVEACAHFRLTLKGGCHHLGKGKLNPRTLTSASLGLLTSTLPAGMCSSCDNKIAVESKFPLKFSN